MTRVIHTADTHIGYRQYHSPERRQDFLDAFEAVVSDAIEADVDAVVHAGDLFHDTRPDLGDLMGTIRILRRLADADIPFLGIVGNHERTRDRQWMDLIADLDLAERLDASGTPIGDVTFYGLDWVPPAQRDRLEYRFDQPDTDAAALVAHGLFEPFAHANWDTEALLEAATIDFDALLLGDNHIPDRAEVNETWVTYAGSTERASASERTERGYNLVTFDESIRISRRTIEGTRSFVFVDVTLEGNEGIDRIREHVLERPIEDAVVIVTIEGDGTDVSPAAVEETARDAGALVVRVNDTRERDDVDERPTVQFSDPDQAIEAELEALGMSPVGHMVDGIVRDATIPDSGVRERVRSRIETLLDQEPEAFVGVAEPESSSGHPEEPGEATDEQVPSDAGTEDDESDETDREASTDGQLSIGEF